jgi:polyhydroxybutyrate depolymerase
MRPHVFLTLALLGSSLSPVAASAAATPSTLCWGHIRTPGASGTQRTHRIGDRRFHVFVPPKLELDRPVPVVLHFHGSTPPLLDGPRLQRTISGMNRAAKRDGYVVVYPRARQLPRWWQWAKEVRGPDVDFVDAMLLDLSGDLCMDPDRIYATGFSSGAIFSYTLACARPELLAAIAPIAGALGVPCPADHRPAVIAFHGSHDERVSYGAGLNSAARFAEAAGCTDPVQPPPHQGDAHRYGWASCDPARDVVFWSLRGAGHTWPGSRVSKLLLTTTGEGKTSMDVDANTLMWAFFQQVDAQQRGVPDEAEGATP